MNSRLPRKALIPLFLPVVGFYSSVVESCPVGIDFASSCSDCHFGGTFNYSASWSTPTVIERNSSDTVTFSLNKNSGDTVGGGGFSAQTDLGTFSASTGSTLISSTNITHNAPISPVNPSTSVIWSFTFNSGNTSGTATFNANGNPVDGNRNATSNNNDLCGGLGPTTGTSGDGNTGGVFPAASASIIINDAPDISAGVGTVSYTEDGNAVTVAPTLSLTDTEDTAGSTTEIQSGSVTITTNYSAADGDVLNINPAICSNLGLSCTGNGTQTITISSGPDPAADFQTIYRAITFSNSSENPSTLPRTVEFSVTDQHSRTRGSTRNVTVARNEDPASFDSPVYNRIGVGTSSDTSQSVPEDSTVQLDFAATDPEGVGLTFSLVSTTPTLVGPEPLITVNSSTGLLSWTPDGTRSSVTAVVGVNDNVGVETDETFSITLNVVGSNDAPEIVEGDGPVTQTIDEDSNPRAFVLTLNAFDIDGDIPTWSISTIAGNGTAIVSPTAALSKAITYTPKPNFFGSDSFVVQISDTVEVDTIQVDVTIDPVNDPPQLSVIPNQTGTENIAFTFDAGTIFSDVDDINNGTDITWSFQSGQPTGMTISNLGEISWTPPQTGNFNQSYGPIVVSAADGGEDSTVAATSAFTIIVSPPDQDLDNVADYNDLCLTVPDSTNADNDNDGTPGSDGGVNDGGDACDLDDDNDGMPDEFEDSNGFDKFNPSDAAADADGDGISNLDEFNDGTNPVLANETIDATGYFTPFTLPSPEPTDIHPDATTVTADNLGPFRPGRHSITWTASNSGNSNLGTTVQTVDIRPIVNFAPDQVVTEGSIVTVNARLNGTAAVYPVTVNYLLSGTAGSSDHTATSGSLVFNSPDTTTSFSFDISTDSQTEGDETVVLTMSDAGNAVIGKRGVHTVTIVERNVLHDVDLKFMQGGVPVSSAYVSEGAVAIEAIVTDPNLTQSYEFDWSATDNSLVPPADIGVSSWSFTPLEGVFRIEVTVTDDQVESVLSNRVSRILKISTTAPTLDNSNSDDEGKDDITEGLGDSDDDGVPDYLDSVDGNSGGENILPSQTVSLVDRVFIETESGLKFKLGTTAMASGIFGVVITDSDIENFGSESGTAPVNALDDFQHVGGGYDFEISGMVAGSSVNVVIPLETAIPVDASYRKFNPATGWSDFVIDNNNALASAPGEKGACPQPGSDLYQVGLNYLDNCLQLTIEDGGLNDADGDANGVIKDPGSVSLKLQDPQTQAVKGGGRIHPLLIILLGLGVLMIYSIRKKEENHW